MGRVLDALRRERPSREKGDLLEAVLAPVLREQGFAVRRQRSGSQFGCDLLCHRTGSWGLEVWKVEAKNLNRPASVADVAPKLIWHYGRATIDRFVLCSVEPVANSVIEMLETVALPAPVALWEGDVLEALIEQSPDSLAALGLSTNDREGATAGTGGRLFEGPCPVKVHVTTSGVMPGCVEYAAYEDRTVSGFPASGFGLYVVMTNFGHIPADVTSLRLVTAEYRPPSQRVARSIIPLGLVQPHRLTATPTTIAGGELELLTDGSIFRLDRVDQETVLLRLRGDVAPGFYSLYLRASGVASGEPFDLVSARFNVNCVGPEAGVVEYFSAGIHYDDAAEHLLGLDEAHWADLLRRSGARGTWLVMGTTQPSVGENPVELDLHDVPVEDEGGGIHLLEERREVVVTFPAGLEPEIAGWDLIARRQLGLDPRMGALTHQLARASQGLMIWSEPRGAKAGPTEEG